MLTVGSALLLLTLFDAMAQLRSVRTRELLEQSVSQGLGNTLGLDLEQATSLLRSGLFLAGAGAAALVILGWFVLKGDTKARIAASVAAVPVLLGGAFAAPFLSALVAASAAMLWSGPARDWFAGREPRKPRIVEQMLQQQSRPAGADVRMADPVTPAPPTQGYGDVPPPAWAPPAAPYPVPPTGSTRPAPVQTACILTWVSCGITAGLGLMVLMSMVSDPARVVEMVIETAQDRGQEVEASLVRPMLWASSAVLVLWSAGAALLAGFVWRRQSWARVALLVSAVLAGLLSVFAFPVSIPHLAATAWVVGMMLSPLTRVWFQGSEQQRRD